MTCIPGTQNLMNCAGVYVRTGGIASLHVSSEKTSELFRLGESTLG